MTEQNDKSNPKNASSGLNANKREAKRAAVLGAERKNRLPLYALAVGVFIGLGAVYAWMQFNKEAPETVSSLPSNSTGSQVTFPVRLFEDGIARHYEHRDGESTIRYFIIRSSDGVLRAAFDACDVCWRAGKGYVQADDVMVCKNCGQQFASVLVNEVKGGCNPAPLDRTIQNDQLIIEVKDIVEGKHYFSSPGKV